MKRLEYMSEKFTRVLRITDAPISVKGRMVGRFLTTCGTYVYPSSNAKADLWSSKSFEKAKHYDETLRSIEDMLDYQKMLKRHGYTTNILLVSEQVAAFGICSGDFDGDDIFFYFVGIKDGAPVYLELVPPEATKVTGLFDNAGMTEKEYVWKVGRDYMGWASCSHRAWKTRNLPDEELIDHVNEFAEKFGVTNLMVGRIYS